jgi:hypothetical protein
VSTAWYQPPPSQPAFTILSSNQLSLTDRQIGRLIEQRMIERGYLKVLVPEDANVAVMIIGYRSLKVLALWARI